jgi:hypothetical protein
MSMQLAGVLFLNLADELPWYKDPTMLWSVIIASAVGLLIIVWGGVRFWVGTTRPAAIKEVHTPTLDRMNESALAQFAKTEDEEGAEEAESNDAPADLLAVVPKEEEPAAGAGKEEPPAKPA